MLSYISINISSININITEPSSHRAYQRDGTGRDGTGRDGTGRGRGRDGAHGTGRKAYPKAMSVLTAMLAASREWNARTFSGHVRHLQECQGSIAMIVAVGRDKLGFLDIIPYLLGRLGEAGVRDRILAQWREIPAGAHDDVSKEFLLEGTHLRRQIDELPAGECVLPQPLERERQSLIDICFDDHAAEGPHAGASRISAKTRAQKWPWLAGTMRLNQNLHDVRARSAELHLDVQGLWNRWTSIGQTNTKSARRRRNISATAVTKFVYRLDNTRGLAAAGDADADDEVDGGGDDPPDDPGGGDDGVDGDRAAAVRRGAGPAGGDGGGGGCGGAAPPAAPAAPPAAPAPPPGPGAVVPVEPPGRAEDRRVVLEYLQHCIQERRGGLFGTKLTAF